MVKVGEGTLSGNLAVFMNQASFVFTLTGLLGYDISMVAFRKGALRLSGPVLKMFIVYTLYRHSGENHAAFVD